MVLRTFLRRWLFLCFAIVGVNSCSDPVAANRGGDEATLESRLSVDCPNCQAPVSTQMNEAFDYVRLTLLSSGDPACYTMGLSMANNDFYLAGSDVYSWPDVVNGQPVYVQASADLQSGGIFLSHKSVYEDRYWTFSESVAQIFHEASHLHLQLDVNGEQQVVELAAACAVG